MHLLHILKSILLDRNILSGELPQQLGNLSGLEMLSLYENSFYGQLPDSVYGLKSLKSMILYSNKFTGILSSAIVNLNNLENINLLYEEINRQQTKQFNSSKNKIILGIIQTIKQTVPYLPLNKIMNIEELN